MSPAESLLIPRILSNYSVCLAASTSSLLNCSSEGDCFFCVGLEVKEAMFGHPFTYNSTLKRAIEGKFIRQCISPLILVCFYYREIKLWIIIIKD